MSGPEDMLGELNSMMSKAVGVQLVQDVVHAYDAYAIAALSAIISKIDVGELVQTTAMGMHSRVSPQTVAMAAWALADAMMNERKKRGLGGLTPQQSDPGPFRKMLDHSENSTLRTQCVSVHESPTNCVKCGAKGVATLNGLCRPCFVTKASE